MSLSSVEKSEILKEYQVVEGDTGSPEVQIALLTNRIKGLTEHFKAHKHDNHSRRGLLKMVSERKKLLEYLSHKSTNRYSALIKKLGLRK